MGALPRPHLPRTPRVPRLPRLRSRGAGFSLPPWRTVRRRLIVLAMVLVALAAAYMFWFRTSSFVEVRTETRWVADQAPDVDSALRAAADGQSTLHLNGDQLRAAVADNPQVSHIAIATDFPHTLLIDVDIREPVGYVKSAGAIARRPTASCSTTAATLPTGSRRSMPTAPATARPGSSVGGDALTVAKVLGAAPKQLAGEINGAAADKDYGVTVDFGPGIELRFGDASGAALKWKALAAVLADPKFKGASYLDLSVPDRPVAGGVPASAHSTAASTIDPTTVSPATSTVPATTPTTAVPATTTPPIQPPRRCREHGLPAAFGGCPRASS